MKNFSTLFVFFLYIGSLFANNKMQTMPDTVKSSEHFSKCELTLGYSNPFNNLFSFTYWDYFNTGYYNFPDYFFLTANNFSTPSYGLTYKYHPNNRRAFRIGMDFNSANSNLKQTRSSSNFSPTRKETYAFMHFRTSVGMEIDKGEGKAQWFAGGDLFYEYSNSKYDITDVGTVEDDVFKNSSFGISPLIGVRYYVSKLISISAESKLNIFYNSYTIDYTSNNGSFTPSFYTYKGSGLSVKISPIGQLGINIHF